MLDFDAVLDSAPVMKGDAEMAPHLCAVVGDVASTFTEEIFSVDTLILLFSCCCFSLLQKDLGFIFDVEEKSQFKNEDKGKFQMI